MANGDINLATLWLPVAPETSKVGPAMEQAGKDAKGKFGQAVKGIGDTIHDDLAKAGTKARDTFTGIGKHITDVFSKAGRDSGKSITDNLSGVAGSLSKIGGSGEQAANHVQALTNALSSVKSGDLNGVSDTIGKIGDQAKLAGTDISDWTAPLQEAANKSADVKGQVAEFAATFKDLPGHIGKVGQAITDLAGPIGIGITLGKQLADQFDRIPAIHDRFFNPDGSYRNPIDSAASQIPGLNILDPAHPRSSANSLPPNLRGAPPVPGSVAGPGSNLLPGQVVPGPSGQPAPLAPQIPSGPAIAPGSGWGAPPPMSQRDMSRIPGLGPIFGSGATGPSTAGGSSGSGGRGGGSGRAGGSGGLNLADSDIWDQVAQLESGGNWSTNTGNGFFGGLQFNQATWNDFQGLDFAERADMASREQQITVANRVPKGERARRWPNTYPKVAGAGGSGGSSSPSSTLTSRGISGGGDFGTSAGHPTAGPPNENMIRSWVQSNFGIPNTFGTGSWENAAHDADGGWHHNLTHDKSQPGYAFDFHGTPQQMSQLANWVADNYEKNTLELIYGGGGFDQSREIKNGRFGDVYGAALNAAHTDHVHWAMSRAPYEDGGSDGDNRPLGSQHDPLYVSSADKEAGGGGGSPFEKQGRDLAQGMSKGFLELFGIDGSVLGKSPLDFGITKLGGGLLNTFLGMAGGGGAGGDGAALPGLGSLLPGLGSMIPSVGAMVSGNTVPTDSGMADRAANAAQTPSQAPVGATGPTFNIQQSGMFLDKAQAQKQIKDAAYTGTGWHPSMTPPAIS